MHFPFGVAPNLSADRSLLTTELYDWNPAVDPHEGYARPPPSPSYPHIDAKNEEIDDFNASLDSQISVDQQAIASAHVLQGSWDKMQDHFLGAGTGRMEEDELWWAVDHPSDFSPAERNAAQFFLDHPDKFTELEQTTDAGRPGGYGIVTLSDFDGFYASQQGQIDALRSQKKDHVPYPSTPPANQSPPGNQDPPINPDPPVYQPPNLPPDPPVVEAPDVDPQPTRDFARKLKAATSNLSKYFSLLDTAAGHGTRDGLISVDDLRAALNNPSLPDALKRSLRFLLDNPAVLNQFDTAAGASGVDGLISKADVDAMLESIGGSSTPAGGGTTSSGAVTNGDWQSQLNGNPEYLQAKSDLETLSAFDFDGNERAYNGLSFRSDGKMSLDNLGWAATDPFGDPSRRAAAQKLLFNPALWSSMDKDGDGLVSRDEFQSKMNDLKSKMSSMESAAKGQGSSSSPANGTGAPTPTDGTTSTSGASTSSGRATSGEPLELALDHISDARDALEGAIEKKTRALEDLMKDPEANKAKISKLEHEIQSLTRQETMLTQLETQLEQMIQNIANMRHEAAMNAIRHIT